MSMSSAALNKMLKEIAPLVIMNKESKKMINICCTEFVSEITTEAQAVCTISKKKIVNGNHVLKALAKLGFKTYKLKAEAACTDSKATKKRKLSPRLEDLGIPEEELLKTQQELFAKAKEEQAKLEQEQLLMPQQGFSSAVDVQQPYCGMSKESQYEHI
ncbi:protein Dr1-like [Pararge aegeria]|uniref:Protein Dr1 n=1 Tax=Pararge aegeria aegeria TaxID=348720 RepID=A0A8S4SJ13_9NEOP|nr:protein Dr1-like [Pararge aegeria]CAH2266438.1 jg5606 [Pararge aegeria aegeria]